MSASKIMSVSAVSWLAIFILILLSFPTLEGSELNLNCGINLRARNFFGPRVANNSDFGADDDGITGFPGSWPWMISAGRGLNESWIHKCAGTLIHAKYVLTAAHCAVVSENWSLRFGDRNLKSSLDDYNVITRQIKKTHIHTKYVGDLSAYYDVAIWELDQEIRLNTFQSPICLPGASSYEPNQYDGQKVTLLGWGLLTPFGSRRNDVLRKAPLKIFSNEYCNATHKHVQGRFLQNRVQISLPRLFPDHLMCAGHEEGQFGSCQGDSGGPIMQLIANDTQMRYVQVGIVQGGVRHCGDPKYPGIYTRIDNPEITEFIESVIKPANEYPDLLKELFEGTETGNILDHRVSHNDPEDPNHQASLTIVRAAQTGNLALTRSLVQAGATVNYQDFGVESPLTAACRFGHFEVAKFLLDAGANVNHKAASKMTCLDSAIGLNATEMVEFLIKKGQVLTHPGETLIQAASSGNLEILKQIAGTGHFGRLPIEDQIIIDGPTNSKGENALRISIDQDRVDLFKFLVEAGANLYQTFPDYPMSLAPLFVAAADGRYEIVKYLVESGLDPNFHAEGTHATPFLHACLGKGRLDMIKYLIEHGANVNEVSQNGYSCLSAALRKKDAKVFEFLKKWVTVGRRATDFVITINQNFTILLVIILILKSLLLVSYCKILKGSSSKPRNGGLLNFCLNSLST
ncbi:uncharacterized protein LOC131887039 [Tigriopus californicus]|uniref:uncharacterized protein LOC131887039 n=1 Tax=Tigriopus californicus TaxID=6832 RepID=UPI0027DA976D|nr:uncharacterized protein LOC131887039 [Tigriopus californicus]